MLVVGGEKGGILLGARGATDGVAAANAPD
jgi:hypothetical protein